MTEKDRDAGREARLAAALRENLKRRKAQGRARGGKGADADAERPDETGAAAGRAGPSGPTRGDDA